MADRHSTDNFSLYSNATTLTSYSGPSTPDVQFDTYDASVLTLAEALTDGKTVYYVGDTINFQLTITNTGTIAPEAYIRNDIAASRVTVTGFTIGGTSQTLPAGSKDLHDIVLYVPSITAPVSPATSADTILVITGTVI
jgi:uncharacterized repeat protein (TIGR01451 family)